MRLLAPLTVLALATFVAASVPSGAQDDKDKEKDKAAKTKPAPRAYSDEDLKKYKDKPSDDVGTEGQAGATGESGDAEAVPGQRRSREYGGYQKLPPSTPSTTSPDSAKADSPPVEEPASPEEADWKARAQQARAPLQAAEGRIQAIQAQIAELRDKLNPMSTTYVLGGNSTAGPGAVLEVEEQIRVKDGELGDARTAAAEAEKSWQSFLEEAREAGVSPAWLKP